MVVLYFSCNLDVGVWRGKPCLPTMSSCLEVWADLFSMQHPEASFYKSDHVTPLVQTPPVNSQLKVNAENLTMAYKWPDPGHLSYLRLFNLSFVHFHLASPVSLLILEPLHSSFPLPGRFSLYMWTALISFRSLLQCHHNEEFPDLSFRTAPPLLISLCQPRSLLHFSAQHGSLSATLCSARAHYQRFPTTVSRNVYVLFTAVCLPRN